MKVVVTQIWGLGKGLDAKDPKGILGSIIWDDGNALCVDFGGGYLSACVWTYQIMRLGVCTPINLTKKKQKERNTTPLKGLTFWDRGWARVWWIPPWRDEHRWPGGAGVLTQWPGNGVGRWPPKIFPVYVRHIWGTPGTPERKWRGRRGAKACSCTGRKWQLNSGFVNEHDVISLIRCTSP